MTPNEPALKVVTIENPYFIKEEREEVIEQKENEAAIAELEAKLDHYTKLSVMSNSLKICLLVMNIIILPVIIGVTVSLWLSKDNKVILADYAAAVSTESGKK